MLITLAAPCYCSHAPASPLAVNEIITYPGRKCIAVYGQKYSTLYDCNATTAFQNVYQGTR